MKSIKSAIILCLLFINLSAFSQSEKEEELFTAINTSNFDKISSLIMSGVDVNVKDKKGNTPAHLVTNKDFYQKLDVLKLLYYKKADLSKKNDNGETPLQIAERKKEQNTAGFLKNPKLDAFFYIQNASFQEFKKKFQKSKLSINKPDNEGNTLLHYSIFRKNDADKAVKFLLKKGADPNKTVWDYYDITMLKGHFEAFKEMLKSKNVNLPSSCLQEAIELNNFDIIKDLVNHGAGITYAIIDLCKFGNTNVEIIKYFKDKGVDINHKNFSGHSALHYACQTNNRNNTLKQINVIKTLIKAGADINTKVIPDKKIELTDDLKHDIGYTPLHFAIESNNLEIVQYLVETGANVNAKQSDYKDTDYIYYAPLLLATKLFYIKIADFLIQKGANINQKDNFRNTSLHLACTPEMYSGFKQTHFNLIKLLLIKGADINVFNNDGKTPFHLACEHKNADKILKLLIENDADINTKDKIGNSPLKTASDKKRFKNFNLLMENNVEIGDFFNKPITLHSAIMSNNYILTYKLVGLGSDVDSYYNSMSPLHVAAGNKNGSNIINLLLSKDAFRDPKIKTGKYKNFTPVDYAILKNRTENAILLIEGGGKSGSENILFETIKDKKFEIARSLILNSKDLNIKTGSKKTLLHYACDCDNYSERKIIDTELVKLLLSKGAKVNIFDYEMRTPLHCAAESNNNDVIAILKAKMKKEKVSLTNSNALMQKELIMQDRIPLDTTHFIMAPDSPVYKFYKDLYFECENINYDFKNLLYKQLINKKILHYSNYEPYNNKFDKYEIPEIMENLGINTDMVYFVDPNTGEEIGQTANTDADIEELSGILFNDEWYFNEKKFDINKIVFAYCPIRKYYRDEVNEDPRYKKVGYFKFDKIKNTTERKKIESRMKLFKKVKYEYFLENEYAFNSKIAEEYELDLYMEKINSPFWTSFGKTKFRNLLIDRVITKQSNAYDFYSGKMLSVKNIKENLGFSFDTIVDIDPETGEDRNLVVPNPINPFEIKSVIFTENWYVDEKTMRIKKEVVAVSPVRWYLGDFTEGNYRKKIAYTLFFKKYREYDYSERTLNLKTPLDKNSYNQKSHIFNNTFYLNVKNTSVNFRKLFIDRASKKKVNLYKLNDNSSIQSALNKDNYTLQDTSDLFNNIGIYSENVIVTEADGTEIMKIERTKGYGIDSICGINSIEKWKFDAKNFKFKKIIYAYSPFIKFYTDNNNEKPKFKLLGYVMNNNPYGSDLGMKLFKKIKYEFGYDSEDYSTEKLPQIEKERPLFWNNFNRTAFKEYIFNEAIHAKIRVYDYKTKKLLTRKQIKRNLLLYTDKVEDIDPETGEILYKTIENKITPEKINSYIFIENWYINENTLQIHKEVVGIAPVSIYYDKTDEENKKPLRKIPFVVYFDSNKKF